MEREINEFRQTRERQLQQQAMRMREGIVKEITDIIMERVKTNGMDLVFDKSGLSMNCVPVRLVLQGQHGFHHGDNHRAEQEAGDARPRKSRPRARPPRRRRRLLRRPARRSRNGLLHFESKKHAAFPRVFYVPAVVSEMTLDFRSWLVAVGDHP